MPSRAGDTSNGAGRLEAHGISARFQGLLALDEVDLSMQKGEIVGLIGPNGAGKSTMVNVLSGFQAPTLGRVVLNGVDITRAQPHAIARQGLVRTFQDVRLFNSLTVEENVEAAALGAGLRRAEARKVTAGFLERMGLADRALVPAAALPHDDERRLSIARVLAAQPEFLLLDEPAAGLNARESDELLELLASIRQDLGHGLLVIEHNMRLIMELCDWIQVLDYGETISRGTPAEVRADPRVREAYLGSAT